MYIHTHALADVQTSQASDIVDDLKKHIAEHGQTHVETRIEEERQRLGRALVIIAENHSAATRSADLALRLLNNNVYRYIASEFFYNSGPRRVQIRNFMRGLSRSLDRILCQYRSLLLALKRNPKYMLFVGPRSADRDIRDRTIAEHFFREHTDRNLNKLTPGILICGRSHGARTPGENQPNTTRLRLEQAGFNILGVLLVTDDLDRATQRRIDTVWPIDETQTDSNAIRLLDFIATTAEYMILPTQNSPFEFLTDVRNGNSAVSIAERYELVVLAKGMPRCQ
jgi:hypothetical protein